MPLDALCLKAVCDELTTRIIGAKIDKVTQPESDMLILSLRGKSVPACRLLLSAGSGDARLHLTGHQFENPVSPPMFCMLLRKHLVGARITEIKQLSAERVLELSLKAVDAIGDMSGKRLVMELVGSHSNIILVNDEGIIIDCLRRISLDKPDKRAVLPGLLYQNPTPQEGKQNPLEITTDIFMARLLKNIAEGSVDKWLLANYYGLSPLICRELSWRAYGAVDFRFEHVEDGGEKLCNEFFALMDAVKSGVFEPCLLVDREDDSPRDFSFMRIGQYEDAMKTETSGGFSEMLETYYTRKAQAARIKQRASNTTKIVKTARDRLVRKMILQKAELTKTADRENLRQCGDIIMANLHLMKKGQKELVAQDFYSSDGKMRSISLDQLKSPEQNASMYYKRYKKAKIAEKHLGEQIGYGERELEYLESIYEAIGLAEGEADIQEIRRELMSAGYIKEPKSKNTGAAKSRKAQSRKPGAKPVDALPMKFTSSTGMRILAGKNNMQNDRLTLKVANKSDMWLHAQKIYGSHVVISCADGIPDERTLFEAATIAAYYSSARAGGKVPIDYTLVKHVKKPSGGRPGMVIYTNYKTITVAPDEALVDRARER